MSKHVPLRCRLCPDENGEFDEISCGDAWHLRRSNDESQGISMILARNDRAVEIVEKALKQGFLILEKANYTSLQESQPSLLKKRQNLFGRLLAMHIMFIPTPKFYRFYLFKSWREVSTWKKICSVGGTLKRIIQRNWVKQSLMKNG